MTNVPRAISRPPLPIIHSISRRSFSGDARLDGEDAKSRALALADWIGHEVRDLFGGPVPDDVPLIVNSTQFSAGLVQDAHFMAIWKQRVETICGASPVGPVSAYECAGWGFSLRFLTRATAARTAILVIADANIHALQAYETHDEIGDFGWGVTTIILTALDGSDSVRTGGPFANFGVAEFVRELRAATRQTAIERVYLPFFKPALERVAHAAVTDVAFGPNYFDTYGHVFGSDPWLSLIHQLIEKPNQCHENVIIGSVAYSGYYSMAVVTMTSQTLALLKV